MPDVDSLPDISVPFATEMNHTTEDGTEEFWPYLRDPDTLARPWAIPGTPQLMHRVGGLEKEDGRGDINYTPDNHQRWCHLRAAKIAGIAKDIPPAVAVGDEDADICVLGWGSTWAAIDAAVQRTRRRGLKVAWVHLAHLNPLPPNLGEVLKRFPKVIVPELNLGQLCRLVRAEYLIDAQSVSKVQGLPFTALELEDRDRRSPAMSDTIVPITTKKDWMSDQEVRWCPGCGDYGIMQAVQQLMPELGIAPENTVFISGIGCSSRFPYYMNTYGMHGIHGRAPAIATGLAVARPDLDVWVVTGDGDGLSIGGNHLIHALRRNVNLTILLFNNRIYGLTKGQYSPTSEMGKVTKSTPFGSVDYPFNPLSVAIGAEASFVARTHDLDRKHMMEVFRAAHAHQGSSFVEIFQNCNVFNDGAFDDIISRQVREEMIIDLKHGQPIRFGADGHKGVTMGSDGQLRIVEVADVGVEAMLVHDAHRDDPGSGVRSGPAVARRPFGNPVRGVPLCRAARLRRRDRPPVGRGVDQEGSR